MDDFVIRLEDWDRCGGKYLCPGTSGTGNWRLHGFVPQNDHTVDLYGWYGFTFETEIDGAEEIVVKAETLEFREGRDLEVGDVFTWKATVAGRGKTRVTAPLSQFDLYTCEPNRWKFVRSVEVSREVSGLCAVRAETVWAGCGVMSKPAKRGETVCYPITLANCTDERQAVSLILQNKGWETLSCEIEPHTVVLEPLQTAVCALSVKMNDRIVPGGFETQTVIAVPNGQGGQAACLEFQTVKYLPFPYLCHTEEGWREVAERANTYAWAARLRDRYIREADEWSIPVIDRTKPYLYITENAHQCRVSAIAWKLTGVRKYAGQCAAFLRTVADPEQGYPKTLRACHQQMVHEGEFFKSCAFTYDLLHDVDVFTEEDHKNIQTTFRLFTERIDWELSGGGISNWSLAMIAGALYCAMCLQDRVLIDRFVYGTGGIIDHMQAGILPDGWWCECTIGYNQMAAGLFSEYAQALTPWGINLKDLWVPAQYARTVQPRVQHVDGLSWDIYGGGSKNYRCVRDLWDSLVAMADYRGVVVGVNDSAESRFGGRSEVGLDSRYDIAYAHYRVPAYARMVKLGGDALRDLLHGMGELPEAESDACRQSCQFDNAGLSVLRSQTPGRPDREQYQGTVKYGSHGGAHGHYDRCSMNSLSRFGRNFYNPESIWYSYGTYLYKFYVQNSITHNMVTADLKLQDPQEGKSLLFYSGTMMQACAAENTARWSNPPYGGWRILMGETFEDRIWHEGRYVPIPDNPPEYTCRTGFTEPVTQRRVMIVTDEYAVNFDFAAGDQSHDYDCIYHVRGLRSVEGARMVKRSEQLTEDPLSSGQFITDCTWYEASEDTVKVSFEMEFTEEDAKRPGWMVENRTGFNEPGQLRLDVYFAGTDGSQIIIGGDPEYEPVNKRLTYRVEADGEILREGRFGAWILGRHHVETDVEGKKELRLAVKAEQGFREGDIPAEFKKTLFWGDPYLLTKSGERVCLASLPLACDNVDPGNGPGTDYYGGPVTIQAQAFDQAVPTEPSDPEQEAVITVDLTGLDAVTFVGEIGGDYPLGDGKERRRFLSQRRYGAIAEFASVIELYEAESRVRAVQKLPGRGVRVELKDGAAQEITVENLEDGTDVTVTIREYRDGILIREERSDNRAATPTADGNRESLHETASVPGKE